MLTVITLAKDNLIMKQEVYADIPGFTDVNLDFEMKEPDYKYAKESLERILKAGKEAYVSFKQVKNVIFNIKVYPNYSMTKSIKPLSIGSKIDVKQETKND